MSTRVETAGTAHDTILGSYPKAPWGSLDGWSAANEPGPKLVLRHVLRALASDPIAMRAPRESLARLRPFVDLGKAEIAAAATGGIHAHEYRRGCAALLDGAIVGLCHVGRFAVDGEAASALVPYAVAAAGPYARKELRDGTALDVLFLCLDDSAAQSRGQRMIAFLQDGLSDLGFSIRCATASPDAVGRLAEAGPEIARCLADLRFVWGGFSLFAELCRRMPAAPPK